MPWRPHISLEVADLDSAIDFYSTFFQASPTKRYPDYANFRLEEPALHLALVLSPGRRPEPNTHQHFGVEVVDAPALLAWQERLTTAGWKIRQEQAVTCCYAVGDKFWVSDADGHDWEVWLRTDEAERMTSDESVCCDPPEPEQTSCCNAADPQLAVCC